jgi:aspartate aminotransferase
MSSLQGQSTSGINALAQAAAIATLKALSVDLKSDSDLSEFKSHLVHYRRRRSQALEILKRQPKLQIFEPQGAFYFFIGFKHFFKPGEDSVGFAERLMKEALVAGVPGTPFGARDFLRFSFATDEKKLFAACERILSYCNH